MTQFKKPPTLEEAIVARLTVDEKHGIHTFSNGTAWDCWADSNCYDCRFWDPDCMGGSCAFEGAAFMNFVSPELARLFGWTQNAKYDKPDDHRHGWHAPNQCPFFHDKSDDDYREPPFVDPTQLVMGGIDPIFSVPLDAPTEIPAYV